jgi:hypothetical protein
MDRLTDLAESLPYPEDSSARQGGTFALLHIPKCAGTSIMRGIEQGFGPGRHVNGFDRCLFGNFEAFDSIPKMMRSVIHLDSAEMPDALTVMGHFSFGTLRGRYPDADLAVFLREPTARLLSHWVYWRALTWFSLRHWGAEWSPRLKLARLPLHGFLSHPDVASQTDNIITRMLVWPHPLIPDNQFIDPANDDALLLIAIKNLANCGFAGITEQGSVVYREFSTWLGITLDLATLNPAVRMRRAARTRLNEELTPATLDLLRQRSRLDDKLWKILAVRKMSEADAETLRENAILQAVARFSLLLA